MTANISIPCWPGRCARWWWTIQGLNAKLEAERDALAGQVERLSAENAALRSTSADIQSRLERLEARLAQDEGR